MKKLKFADGVIAQEMDPDEVTDGETVTMAFIKLCKDARVAIMWSPLLFVNPNLPLPDDLREVIVKALRYHADKIENRQMDEQMKKLAGKMMGDA